MDMAAIVEFINNTGFAIVLMAYFLIKDWKFNQSMLDLMGEINKVLTKLETWHAKDNSDGN